MEVAAIFTILVLIIFWVLYVNWL